MNLRPWFVDLLVHYFGRPCRFIRYVWLRIKRDRGNSGHTSQYTENDHNNGCEFGDTETRDMGCMSELNSKTEFDIAFSLDSIGIGWQMQPVMLVAICEQ